MKYLLLFFLLLFSFNSLQAQNLLYDPSTDIETILKVMNNAWELKEKCVEDSCQQISGSWGIETNNFKGKNYKERRGIWGRFFEGINPITFQKEAYINSCPYYFGIEVIKDSLSQIKTYQFARIGEGGSDTLQLILLHEKILVFEGIEYFHNGEQQKIREAYFLRKEN